MYITVDLFIQKVLKMRKCLFIIMLIVFSVSLSAQDDVSINGFWGLRWRMKPETVLKSLNGKVNETELNKYLSGNLDELKSMSFSDVKLFNLTFDQVELNFENGKLIGGDFVKRTLTQKSAEESRNSLYSKLRSVYKCDPSYSDDKKKLWTDPVTSALCGMGVYEDESPNKLNVAVIYSCNQKSDKTKQEKTSALKNNIYGVWCLELGMTKREALMSLEDYIHPVQLDIAKYMLDNNDFMSFSDIPINGITFNHVEVRFKYNRINKIELKINKEDMSVINLSYDKLFNILTEKYGKGVKGEDLEFPAFMWIDEDTHNNVLLFKKEEMLVLIYLKYEEIQF